MTTEDLEQSLLSTRIPSKLAPALSLLITIGYWNGETVVEKHIGHEGSPAAMI